MLASPILQVFVLAMLPFGELRVALPLALTVYELPLSVAYPVTVAGNMVPAVAIVYLLDPIADFLSRHNRWAKRFFDWLFGHSLRRHTKRFEAIGAVALVTLVAIPLPMTGAWTGALAASVFGIEPRRSLPLILLGVLIAGAIVAAVTMAGITIF